MPEFKVTFDARRPNMFSDLSTEQQEALRGAHPYSALVSDTYDGMTGLIYNHYFLDPRDRLIQLVIDKSFREADRFATNLSEISREFNGLSAEARIWLLTRENSDFLLGAMETLGDLSRVYEAFSVNRRKKRGRPQKQSPISHTVGNLLLHCWIVNSEESARYSTENRDSLKTFVELAISLMNISGKVTLEYTLLDATGDPVSGAYSEFCSAKDDCGLFLSAIQDSTRRLKEPKKPERMSSDKRRNDIRDW